MAENSQKEINLNTLGKLPSALYVVATPIGNLADLSPRALQTLREVDEILCEDTRTTGQMLRHFGVQNKLVAYHDHNESQRVTAVLSRLQSGARIALVSDAGTPLISDPGYHVVAQARAAGHSVIAIPGPSALTAALSICGLPCERFRFEGFLPSASGARRAQLQALSGEVRTMAFYESTHRILDLLDDAVAVFGSERKGAVVKELSKMFERCFNGTLAGIRQQLSADANLLKGEFVVIIEGTSAAPELAEAKRIYALLASELSPSQAAKLAAKLTGVSRRELYGGEG